MPFTTSDYIITRLAQQNVEAVFGVPAVYCAPVFEAAANAANFRAVVTSSDLVAGYAADGYARTRGLSAVSVAYGVGTLSLLNAIAGAYIERSPVVVINGGPSQARIDQLNNTGILFSHSMGRPHSDLEAFRPFTCFAERATSQPGLPALIDRAIAAAVTKKHPVYLEIPQVWLGATCPRPTAPLNVSVPPGTAEATARRLLTEIRNAQQPLLIVGIEIQRYKLAAAVQSVIRKLSLRWATTLLAKSTLPESDPGFLGVFNGEHAPSALLAAIRSSDLVVALGAVFGSGHASTMVPKIASTIRFWDNQVFWRRGDRPEPVPITHLVSFLDRLPLSDARTPRSKRYARLSKAKFKSEGEVVWDGDAKLVRAPSSRAADPTPVPSGLSYDALFQVIAEPSFLDSSMTIVADTFLGIYPAAKLKMPAQDSFVASALWASIGHSLAAAVGVAVPGGKRPVVICGDGGAQMVMEALSTMVAQAERRIVVLVDNGLYGYEQYLLKRSYYASSSEPPLPYAVLGRWDYVATAKAMGVSFARTADSAATLRAALSAAKAFNAGPAFVHAVVRSRSLPSGL
jgi:indolepyruvate decarboxylase